MTAKSFRGTMKDLQSGYCLQHPEGAMTTRSVRILAASMLSLAVLASALAETAPLKVTYYYLPG